MELLAHMVHRMWPTSFARVALLTTLLLLLAIAWFFTSSSTTRSSEPKLTGVDPNAQPLRPEATHEQVVSFCGACHCYPDPKLFAKYSWAEEVVRGFEFYRQSGLELAPPPSVEIVRYYINRAPADLPPLERAAKGDPSHLRTQRLGFHGDKSARTLISHVRFVHLFDEKRLDVLACDMAGGRVLALRPYEPSTSLIVLAENLNYPDHAEVNDLDRDGIKDVLVAVLGSLFRSDELVGRVVWLRGDGHGRFAPMTLLDGVGRVADAQAADFDGDGDLDLVVAEFGYLRSGATLYLENQTSDPEQPRFVSETLDDRHGCISVPIADLDADGGPDFVALISQEHEVVEAFLNRGGGSFEKRTIFAAPHPAFGSSGIQPVDLDRDGDLDVLMTNGDVLDKLLLKPFHGIQWLENTGDFPFTLHRLDSFYGASRAVAGDLDGDGDLDIAATSFLPGGHYLRVRYPLNLDAIVQFEQTAPGRFVRHRLETLNSDFPACDLGDFDADGRLDFVAGTCILADHEGQPDPEKHDWIVIYRGLPSGGRAGAGPGLTQLRD